MSLKLNLSSKAQNKVDMLPLNRSNPFLAKNKKRKKKNSRFAKNKVDQDYLGGGVGCPGHTDGLKKITCTCFSLS